MNPQLLLEITGLLRVALTVFDAYNRGEEITPEEMDAAFAKMNSSLAAARAIVAGPQDT